MTKRLNMIRGLKAPICLFFLLLLIGTVAYHHIEGWRYLDAAYFSVITMATIGYGDFSPQTDLGKIFTIFFALFGIGVMLYFFTLVGRYFFVRYKRETLRNEGRLKSTRGIKRV